VIGVSGARAIRPGRRYVHRHRQHEDCKVRPHGDLVCQMGRFSSPGESISLATTILQALSYMTQRLGRSRATGSMTTKEVRPHGDLVAEREGADCWRGWRITMATPFSQARTVRPLAGNIHGDGQHGRGKVRTQGDLVAKREKSSSPAEWFDGSNAARECGAI